MTRKSITCSKKKGWLFWTTCMPGQEYEKWQRHFLYVLHSSLPSSAKDVLWACCHLMIQTRYAHFPQSSNNWHELLGSKQPWQSIMLNCINKLRPSANEQSA